jgi:excisionase family DNA binding protein
MKNSNSELMLRILDKVEKIEAKLEGQFVKTETTQECLNIDQTCLRLGVSKRTLQKYRDNGLITFSQIRGKIYFRKQDLEEFMERHRVKAFSHKGRNGADYGFRQNTS